MKKYFLLFLMISLCFMQRGERWKNRMYKNPNAGNKDKLELQKISDEAKMLFYQTEKLSPEKAALYQLAMPIPFVNLGYAYSDNWGKGLKWDFAMSLALIQLGQYKWGRTTFIHDNIPDQYVDTDDCSGGSPYYCPNPDKEHVDGMGYALVLLTFIKMFDSYQSAEKYNDQLFKRVFKRKRPSFAFNYSLENKGTELTMSYPLN